MLNEKSGSEKKYVIMDMNWSKVHSISSAVDELKIHSLDRPCYQNSRQIWQKFIHSKHTSSPETLGFWNFIERAII